MNIDNESNLESPKTKFQKFLPYLITLAVGTLMFFLLSISLGIFKTANSKYLFKILSNAAFITGVMLAGYGLLIVASNGGTFDMIVFGVKKAVSVMFRDPIKRKNNQTFYEYRTAKMERKQSFLFLVVIGALFIILALLFSFIYIEYHYIPEQV